MEKNWQQMYEDLLEAKQWKEKYEDAQHRVMNMSNVCTTLRKENDQLVKECEKLIAAIRGDACGLDARLAANEVEDFIVNNCGED